MASVIIGAVTYEVYGDVAAADEYFNASSSYATWAAYDADTKARGLVSATRLLDRQTWQGELTAISPETGLAWPRTGVTDRYGDAVDSETIPEDIIEASFLLALDINSGGTVETSATNEDLTKRLKAGSVEIEKFRADQDTVSRFPLSVSELINQYLTSNVAIATSLSFGVDAEPLDDTFDYNGGF